MHRQGKAANMAWLEDVKHLQKPRRAVESEVQKNGETRQKFFCFWK